MRRIASARVDLPEPDSPARPNRSPGASAKLTSSTACTMPSGWSNATREAFARDRTGWRSRAPPQPRIGDLVEPDSQKKQAEKHVRMITVGAVHHHHQPLIIAALKLTQ